MQQHVDSKVVDMEVQRIVPPETIAEMQEAGFFQVLQPNRWGGYEMDPRVFYSIQMELAKGCMATGKAEPVEGGYTFNGNWSWSSGSIYCDWILLGGLLPGRMVPVNWNIAPSYCKI